jgi:hypothetical protein
MTYQQALAAETKQVQLQHRRFWNALPLVAGVLLGVCLAVSLNCTQNGKPLPEMDISGPIQVTTDAATTLHGSAQDLKLTTGHVRDTVLNRPSQVKTSVPADMDKVDQSADKIDQVATQLQDQVVVPLQKDDKAIKTLQTTVSDQADTIAKLQKANATAAHGWLLAVSILAALTGVGCVCLPFAMPGVSLLKTGPIALICLGVTVACTVLNIYYEQIAFWGLIVMGVLGVGGVVFAVIQIRNKHAVAVQATTQVTKLATVVQALHQDMVNKGQNEQKLQWFGHGALPGEIDKSTDHLINGLVQKGTIKAVLPPMAKAS